MAKISLTNLSSPYIASGVTTYNANLAALTSSTLITSAKNNARHGTSDYWSVGSDADITFTVGTTPWFTRHTGTLTANRTITLSTTGAVTGAKFKVTRTGSGAFNLSVGGLKNLTTNTWCEVVYNGSAWYLSAYGAL